MGYLLRSLATFRKHPVLLWLPATYVLAGAVFNALVNQPSHLGRYAWLPLLVLPLVPALSGGMNALIRNAITRRPVTAAAFAQGARAFYMRIAAAGVLLLLVEMLAATLTRAQGAGSLVLALGRILGHVWFAEVIMGDASFTEGLTRGWGAVQRRPAEYGMLLLAGIALQLAVPYLLAQVLPVPADAIPAQLSMRSAVKLVVGVFIVFWTRTAVFHLHVATRGQGA